MKTCTIGDFTKVQKGSRVIEFGSHKAGKVDGIYSKGPDGVLVRVLFDDGTYRFQCARNLYRETPGKEIK